MSLIFAKWEDKTISIDEYDKNIHIHVTCPLGHKLCGKQGTIKMWHFAHYSDENCDPWKNQGMSQWHRSLQEMVFDRSLIEYRIERNGVLHIADIFNSEKNLIIELQHSPISIETIEQREEFYGNMIWIFDCTEKEKIEPVRYFTCNGTNYVILQSKTQYWISCDKPTFYDIGDGMAEFIVCNSGNTYQIFCKFHQYREFFQEYFPKCNMIEKYLTLSNNPQYDSNTTLNIPDRKIFKTMKIPNSERKRLLIFQVGKEIILQLQTPNRTLESRNEMHFQLILKYLKDLNILDSFSVQEFQSCILFSERKMQPKMREDYTFTQKQVPQKLDELFKITFGRTKSGFYVCKTSDLVTVLRLPSTQKILSNMLKTPDVKVKSVSIIPQIIERILRLGMSDSIILAECRNLIRVENPNANIRDVEKLKSVIRFDSSFCCEISLFLNGLEMLENRQREEIKLEKMKTDVVLKLSDCIELNPFFLRLILYNNGTFKLFLHNPDNIETGNRYLDLKPRGIIGIKELLAINYVPYNPDLKLENFLIHLNHLLRDKK